MGKYILNFFIWLFATFFLRKSPSFDILVIPHGVQYPKITKLVALINRQGSDLADGVPYHRSLPATLMSDTGQKKCWKLFHENLSFSSISIFQLSTYFFNYTLFHIEKLLVSCVLYKHLSYSYIRLNFKYTQLVVSPSAKHWPPHARVLHSRFRRT